MIQDAVRLRINGVEQFISIRSEKHQAPLLLYLHGGPGASALPLVRKYNRELEKHFIVVVWEQRGAGKSYYSFAKDESVTIDTFLEDMRYIIRYLLERFGQSSVYLVGHSWGSVLGLRFVQEHPEYVHTYVGCGQVVNMKKSCRIAYEYAWEHANRKERSRLETVDCTYTGEDWFEQLLYVSGLVVKYKGSLYGQSSYAKLAIPFLFGGGCNILDLVRHRKGRVQSVKRLWQELMKVDFEGVTVYDVPLIFVEGRHDYLASSDLLRDYYRRICSSKQLVWFERSCHFPQWSESAKFHQVMFDALT